jgi:hypothetical protein
VLQLLGLLRAVGAAASRLSLMLEWGRLHDGGGFCHAHLLVAAAHHTHAPAGQDDIPHATTTMASLGQLPLLQLLVPGAHARPPAGACSS